MPGEIGAYADASVVLEENRPSGRPVSCYMAGV